MWTDWEDPFDELWGVLNEDFDDFDFGDSTRPSEKLEHFTYVDGLAHSWNWANGRGNIVDLRKIPIQYVLTLTKWMETHHDEVEAPYKGLRQYKLLQRRIKKDQAWIDLAKRVLQGPKHTWQRLRTYS